MLGATKTLFKERGRESEERKLEPERVIGMREPLPTVTAFPVQGLRGEFKIPDEEARCAVAPESMYQLAAPGSARVIVLNA